MEAPNILILDEPTNDLDITTLAILEEYLQAFQGIVIAVSHDRYFLDKVVNSICEIEKGNLYKYKGNYTKFLIQKEENMKKQREKRKLGKNKENKIELVQPSGYSINIELEENKNYIENAIISGIVEEE